MKYKLFPAPIFKHFIQSNPPTIVKLKSLGRVWSGQLPHKNGAISFHLASRPYDNFKISPNLSACSSKSYKYDKYDKTTYCVFPYC